MSRIIGKSFGKVTPKKEVAKVEEPKVEETKETPKKEVAKATEE